MIMYPLVYIRDHSTLGNLRVHLSDDLLIPLAYLSNEESIKKAIEDDLYELIYDGSLDCILPCSEMSDDQWMFWEDHVMENIDKYADIIWRNVKDK